MSDESLKLVIGFLLLIAFLGFAMHLRGSGATFEEAAAKMAIALVVLGLIYFLGPILVFFVVFTFPFFL